ncbi:hypothetical protein G7Z17_g471 [Cylindrodendrum hubeiense]|uniref:Zn(2)-C6 fungal-type domain-containing protein n=1 Tax=Cylindrodendrum hubeiense TaxID=595255 RepID=A0A9P5HLH7_9HYPO|nr:hypothetical protein G7Z17_g471 [Cylindrodendrum hubeiense]
MTGRTIRSHLKSRRGCLNCKSRRVKCDEVKPGCSACARRGDECTYLSRADRPSGAQRVTPCSASPSTTPVAGTGSEIAIDAYYSVPRLFDYGDKQMMQLRLMHHYDTTTVKSFASAFQLQGSLIQGLQVDIPSLAFKHPFLLDTVLLVAMIHMASIRPESVNMLEVAKYRNQAICAIRGELANVSDDNIRAIRMSSLLLGATSFAADRITGYSGIWLTNFLALTIGSRVFMPSPKTGSRIEKHVSAPEPAAAASHFRDPQAHSSMPLSLQRALDIEQDDEDWAYREDLYRAASGIGTLFGSLDKPHTTLSIVFQLKSWPFRCVSDGFVQLARLQRPRALLIMAYYLAFLQYFPAMWLYEDVVREDMQKIATTLSPEWHEYLSIPMTAVLLEEESSLTEYLLGQLPNISSGELAEVGHLQDIILRTTPPRRKHGVFEFYFPF